MNQLQLSTFVIDHETFGIPTLLVEELFRPQPVTKVPGSDHRIEGITNIRGKTAVVINMRKCLQLHSAPPRTANEMILLETSRGLVKEAEELHLQAFEEPVILRVDETTSICQVNIDAVEPAPAHVLQAFVDGVAKSGERYITLISVTRLINEILNSQSEVKHAYS
jgi:chemotaxis signal transduction protein